MGIALQMITYQSKDMPLPKPLKVFFWADFRVMYMEYAYGSTPYLIHILVAEFCRQLQLRIGIFFGW